MTCIILWYPATKLIFFYKITVFFDKTIISKKNKCNYIGAYMYNQKTIIFYEDKINTSEFSHGIKKLCNLQNLKIV